MIKRTPTEHEEEYGQRIWDYMKLNHNLKRVDLILGLGSIDLLPARRAAEVYFKGLAKVILFTGGSNGRNYELLPNSRGDTTEAEMLAKEAMEHGIPKDAILLEDKAKNSGENVRFSQRLLKEREIRHDKIIVSHMPSAERRDYATLMKQWKGPEFLMTSPNIGFREYHIEGYQGLMSRRDLINDMLGDFHRLFVFPRPEFGYLVSQEELGFEAVPDNVKNTYLELVKRWYGADQLVRDKQTGKPCSIFE